MNGVLTTEQRLVRKRALEAELAVVRSQKAEVLRAIGQISKKQKLGGPQSAAAQATPGSKVCTDVVQRSLQYGIAPPCECKRLGGRIGFDDV